MLIEGGEGFIDGDFAVLGEGDFHAGLAEIDGEEAAVVFAVVDEEDGAADSGGGGGIFFGVCADECFAAIGEAFDAVEGAGVDEEGEGAAAVGECFDGDVAAEEFDEAFGDGEAEA